MTETHSARPLDTAIPLEGGDSRELANESASDRPGRRRGPRRLLRSAAYHAILIAAGFVMLYPLLWMIASSFKPDALIFREPGLIPSSTTLDNYSDGWNALLHPFHHYLINSTIVV